MNKNKLPSFFHLYLDNETQFEMLSYGQAGMLIKALFAYANRGEEPEFDDLTLRLFFSLLKNSMDREFENYGRLCEQNRKNINKRYTGVYDRRQEEKEEEKENEKENEKEKEDEDEDTHEEINNGEEADASSCERVISEFNQICSELPRVRKLTKQRIRRIKKALPQLDGEGFVGLFERVARSGFLCGSGLNGWKADFDWIIKPENLTRILEGCYDPPTRATGGSSYDICELEEINRLDGF